MKYMLVNVSGANLPVDLHNPTKCHKHATMNAYGPEVAIRLLSGQSVDILPYYNGSLEKAHAAIKYSRDVLRLLKPNRLVIHVCDDSGNVIDIEKLLSGVKVEPLKVVPARHADQTRPDQQLSAVIAAQDSFETKKLAEEGPKKIFKIYKRAELKFMKREVVNGIAREMGFTFDDSRTKKDEVIDCILGAQVNGEK